MRDISYKSVGVTYDRLRGKITFDLMECPRIPGPAPVHGTSHPLTNVRPVSSPLNKAAFLCSATLLIEEISFYFIYGHNVQGGFLLPAPPILLLAPSNLDHIFHLGHASFLPPSTPVRFDSHQTFSIACCFISRWLIDADLRANSLISQRMDY